MAMPIHIADPLVRLVEVKRLCDNMKVSPETPVTALLNQLALSVLPTSAYVDTTMTLFNKFTFMVSIDEGVSFCEPCACVSLLALFPLC